MQNMDFHNRTMIKNYPPQYDTQDPEYFSRMTDIHHREEERNRHKASRIMSLIVALCIISFTSGLVIGIKFASGSKNEIVDEHTRQAVTTIGKKVSSLINENASAETPPDTAKTRNLFPREEYPFVIRIGGEFDKARSQEIAHFLSGNGYTVILSRNMDHYRIYTGPYKGQKDAEISLKKLAGQSNKALSESTRIMKR